MNDVIPAGLVAAAVGTVGIITAAFTSSELLTIIAATGGLVTIIGGVVVNIVVTLRGNKVVEKVHDEVVEVKAQTETIGGHVNSAATKAEERIASLENEIRLLRDVMAEKKETAALLAQASIQPAQPAQPTQPVKVDVVNEKDNPVPTSQEKVK